MHEDTIQEALAALKQIDPDGVRFAEVVNGMGEVLRGQNNLVALMALLACVDSTIQANYRSASGSDEKDIPEMAQQTMNFMYHLAIGCMTKSASEAGVFDDLIGQIEKFEAEEDGQSTDH